MHNVLLHSTQLIIILIYPKTFFLKYIKNVKLVIRCAKTSHTLLAQLLHDLFLHCSGVMWKSPFNDILAVVHNLAATVKPLRDLH